MPSIDLFIENDDIVLSSIGEPLLVEGVNCVAQDIRHMIIEKGYAWRMIGERNQTTIAAICTEIEIEMENDERIYPGTANVYLDGESLICEAKTVADEKITVTV